MNNLKKLSLLMIFIVLSVTTIMSQDSTYNFAAYKFPTVNRKALDFNGSLNGGYTNYNSPITNSNNTSLDNIMSLSYSTFKNDEKSQKNSYTQVRNYYTYDDENQFNFNPYASINYISRQYQENEKFVEIGTKSSLNYQNQKSFFTSNFESKNLFFQLAIPVKFGKGRIDPISNVFLANFIAEDLIEQGVIRYPLTQDQLFSLADQIGILNNLRIFDYRKFRVHVIKSLNEWAIENLDINPEKQIELFTTITDNWFYAITGTRANGYRSSFALTPTYNYYKNFVNDIAISNEIAVELFYEYTNQKPISSTFQQNNFFVIGFRGSKNYATFREETSIEPFIHYEKSFIYYPTSRTNIYIIPSITYQGKLTNYQDAFLNDYNRHSIAPLCRLGMSYQLSMQTRINASFNIRYNYNFTDSYINYGSEIYAISENNDFYLSNIQPLPFIYYSDYTKLNTSLNIFLTHSFF